MRQLTAIVITAVLLTLCPTGILIAQDRDPAIQGRPLSAWIHSIRDRDSKMDQAFDVIKTLGPRASAAVPELMQLIDEPFDSIRVGIDDDEVIMMKLADIQVRANAIDSLAAMGQAASPATVPLITWALTKRVIPSRIASARDYQAYVDLVTLDILERMRVVNVICKFRLEAAQAILVLLSSDVTDERKFGVAILQAHTLPVASDLLKSNNCDDRKLGMALLVDMWGVVPTDHLVDLKQASACAVATK